MQHDYIAQARTTCCGHIKTTPNPKIIKFSF